MPGIPPFGFKYEEGKLVPDGTEQETITVMRGMREINKESFSNIAAGLNTTGRLNRGKYWSAQAVQLILKRPPTITE